MIAPPPQDMITFSFARLEGGTRLMGRKCLANGPFGHCANVCTSTHAQQEITAALRAAITAGSWAPSPHNPHPWSTEAVQRPLSNVLDEHRPSPTTGERAAHTAPAGREIVLIRR
ncbi:hypothetical protein ABT061_45075 [Streptosporangium sp. NPDC002544]|uniref:hypothetical protein n=1 Tax=Streptosporangium sp. NPDC002544 TaxID=3154538 RepID=UPI00333269C6